MFHSYPGTQHTSRAVRNLPEEISITQSMSRHDICWDNAPQESFYSHMKAELHLGESPNFYEIEKEIKEYVEYYNNFFH